METLIHGNCLEKMQELPEQSIDAIMTDLPYGITENKWDTELDLQRLWKEYKRLLKENGVVALTASQPFSSKLVLSNLEMFKHEWIWIKNRGSNFANTVREPFKEHEHILIFANRKWKYNPQMQERTGGGKSRVSYDFNFKTKSKNYREFEDRLEQTLPDKRVPSSWQKFNTETGLHPTQKPVSLFEYLIKTYTDEEDTVLDSCMGCGTTGVAAVKQNRKFIGVELDEKYFRIAEKRIGEVKRQGRLFDDSPIPPTDKSVGILGDF